MKIIFWEFVSAKYLYSKLLAKEFSLCECLDLHKFFPTWRFAWVSKSYCRLLFVKLYDIKQDQWEKTLLKIELNKCFKLSYSSKVNLFLKQTEFICIKTCLSRWVFPWIPSFLLSFLSFSLSSFYCVFMALLLFLVYLLIK